MTTDIDLQAVIDEMVRRLVERFDPLQVVLFGSHARGEAGPDSDVDLLLVMPEDRREEAMHGEALGAVSGCGVSVDVIVRTPAEVWRQRRVPGSLVRHAMEEGRVVYEHDERPAEARRMLSLARDDLRMAEMALEGEISWGACFHAQQAAEKALKSGLIIAGVDYPRTHELDTLIELLPDDWPLRRQFGDLRSLSDWAVGPRYGGDGRAEREAGLALETARAILAAVMRDLRAHGLEVEDEGARP